MYLRDFGGERGSIYFGHGKHTKKGMSSYRQTAEIFFFFFFRQEVITCYITMHLIITYGTLITCLSAELN